MPLSPGDKLGPYEILALIGKGGMGEVYRAHDTRLLREVAIKVAAGPFSDRFEREARAVAALNHPNICAIYDVGALPSGAGYLVMELVEGPTLADRLQQGAIPWQQAEPLMVQIAAAVAAAHEKGIVHRDLKPANIKIRADGTVKVLDFGLAKVTESTPQARPLDSQTVSLGSATTAGVILGTAPYMSPEQARGLTVDKRADIWAFGVVLFEMLAGKRLFKGATVSDVLVSVLSEEPDWSVIPEQARRLLRACLQRDLKQRLHDMADAQLLLENAPSGAGPVRPEQARPWPWIAATVLLLATISVVAFTRFRTTPVESGPIRFQVSPPDKASFVSSYFKFSPDGRCLVLSAIGADSRAHIWLRSLDSLEAKEMPGTEGGVEPVWSPDGRSIVFYADGRYKKVDLSGAQPDTVCEGGNRGVSWSKNGILIFAGAVVSWVPPEGGKPVPVTALDPARQESFHARPFFLPDGIHFLYVRVSNLPEYTGIYVGSVDAKPNDQPLKRLLPGQIGVVYAPRSTAEPESGYLLFQRDQTVLAQAFDARKLELTGEPVPVAEPVGDNGNAIGYFTAGPNGILAFRGGREGAQLTWYDRQGAVLRTVSEPGRFTQLALSSDGTRAALTRYGSNQDIWLVDLTRGASTRFTFDPAIEQSPVWSPDGSQVVFASSRKGGWDLYRKSSNGAGGEEVLLESAQAKYPLDWSPDGRFLLYAVQGDKATDRDLWVLSNPGASPNERKAEPFLATPFREDQAKFSPDGHWIAYASDESGQLEVYIRPFPVPPNGGEKWMVSNAGGSQPRWRPDGKELFYIAKDSRMMSVEISANRSFAYVVPKPLFAVPSGDYAVAPDGHSFLRLAPLADERATPLTVVLNWTALLKK